MPTNIAKSMRAMPLSFVLLASFWAGFAIAASWSTVARNGESVVEIDSGSLTRKGQTVRAWSRQVYGEDQPLPLGDPPFRAVRYLYSYECGKRSALLIRRTYVNEQGEPIKDQLLEGLEMAKDIVPGTLQERVYDQACKAAKETVAQKGPAAKATAADGQKPTGKPSAALAKEGKDDPLAEPANAEPASDGTGHDEPQPEHAKSKLPAKSPSKPASKRAKPMLVAKAKAAKEEEAPSAGRAEAAESEHEAGSPANEQSKSEKVAVAEKKSKHDEECDNCEDGEAAAEDKPSTPLPPRPLVKPLWRVVSDPDRGLIYEFATHSGAAAKAKEFAEDRVARGYNYCTFINYY
ncbi:MAG: hypothetical protein EXR36_00710 [Betaproteobacteria bacterium]|nr:hypothetical protein [Betaproteobacteria bacterium]